MPTLREIRVILMKICGEVGGGGEGVNSTTFVLGDEVFMKSFQGGCIYVFSRE